jgi:hypothetical protein
MSSSINPNLINGLYPIAGQDNDSQGFRDNFTNIKNNLNFAKTEINDLQNKVVLKSPLSGSTINNNMAGTILSNVSLNSERHSVLDHGGLGNSSSPTDVDIDFNVSTIHILTANGDLDFNIINMPLGSWASVKLLIQVTDPTYYIRFSNTNTNNGFDRVEGIDAGAGQAIYFSDVGSYPSYFLFEISSYDGGSTKNINDVFRGRNQTDFGFTVNGDLVITGDLNSAAGRINSGYFLANVVTGQNLVANVDYNRFIANASPHGTVANLFITLPSNPVDGREITITTLVPITSCFVSNMTPGVQSVYWLANNWATSGNVSATLVYNETIERWMKV